MFGGFASRKGTFRRRTPGRRSDWVLGGRLVAPRRADAVGEQTAGQRDGFGMAAGAIVDRLAMLYAIGARQHRRSAAGVALPFLVFRCQFKFHELIDLHADIV
jgi:hypothetical protein